MSVSISNEVITARNLFNALDSYESCNASVCNDTTSVTGNTCIPTISRGNRSITKAKAVSSTSLDNIPSVKPSICRRPSPLRRDIVNRSSTSSNTQSDASRPIQGKSTVVFRNGTPTDIRKNQRSPSSNSTCSKVNTSLSNRPNTRQVSDQRKEKVAFWINGTPASTKSPIRIHPSYFLQPTEHQGPSRCAIESNCSTRVKPVVNRADKGFETNSKKNQSDQVSRCESVKGTKGSTAFQGVFAHQHEIIIQMNKEKEQFFPVPSRRSLTPRNSHSKKILSAEADGQSKTVKREGVNKVVSAVTQMKQVPIVENLTQSKEKFPSTDNCVLYHSSPSEKESHNTITNSKEYSNTTLDKKSKEETLQCGTAMEVTLQVKCEYCSQFLPVVYRHITKETFFDKYQDVSKEQLVEAAATAGGSAGENEPVIHHLSVKYIPSKKVKHIKKDEVRNENAEHENHRPCNLNYIKLLEVFNRLVRAEKKEATEQVFNAHFEGAVQHSNSNYAGSSGLFDKGQDVNMKPSKVELSNIPPCPLVPLRCDLVNSETGTVCGIITKGKALMIDHQQLKCPYRLQRCCNYIKPSNKVIVPDKSFFIEDINKNKVAEEPVCEDRVDIQPEPEGSGCLSMVSVGSMALHLTCCLMEKVQCHHCRDYFNELDKNIELSGDDMNCNKPKQSDAQEKTPSLGWVCRGDLQRHMAICPNEMTSCPLPGCCLCNDIHNSSNVSSDLVHATKDSHQSLNYTSKLLPPKLMRRSEVTRHISMVMRAITLGAYSYTNTRLALEYNESVESSEKVEVVNDQEKKPLLMNTQKLVLMYTDEYCEVNNIIRIKPPQAITTCGNDSSYYIRGSDYKLPESKNICDQGYHKDTGLPSDHPFVVYAIMMRTIVQNQVTNAITEFKQNKLNFNKEYKQEEYSVLHTDKSTQIVRGPMIEKVANKRQEKVTNVITREKVKSATLSSDRINDEKYPLTILGNSEVVVESHTYRDHNKEKAMFEPRTIDLSPVDSSIRDDIAKIPPRPLIITNSNNDTVNEEEYNEIYSHQNISRLRSSTSATREYNGMYSVVDDCRKTNIFYIGDTSDDDNTPEQNSPLVNLEAFQRTEMKRNPIFAMQSEINSKRDDDNNHNSDKRRKPLIKKHNFQTASSYKEPTFYNPKTSSNHDKLVNIYDQTLESSNSTSEVEQAETPISDTTH